jgi:hypothetical protein
MRRRGLRVTLNSPLLLMLSTRYPGVQQGMHKTALRQKLHFSRVIGFRDADRPPEDATSPKELVELYEQQPGRALE